jgi:UTP--glucose-1-phosphate uridylyltransferase
MNNSNYTIKKAVIAAGGFGTRFLPQTKAMPKEMLPLINKPVIQYIVEELVAVGVKDIIIVTGYSKRAIEDHFDRPIEDLRLNLRKGGKQKEPLLKEITKIADLANFIYVRQKGPYGTGTPILNCEHLIGDEPFYYTWSDDFFVSKPLRFQQMLDVYNQYLSPVLSTIKIKNDEDYDKYGICSGTKLGQNLIQVEDITEKPGKNSALSDNATVSGYILTKDIFRYLHHQMKHLDLNREFYAVDALKLMVQDVKKVIALNIKNGKYYDMGNVLDYHKTVIEFALNQPDIGPLLKQHIKDLIR